MVTFHCYKDTRNEWRWRLEAGNNKKIAESGEGYTDRRDCLHAIDLIQQGAATSSVLDVTQTPWALIRTGPAPP
jgi:uncharacterized protein YegP (UPF0339 family)